MLLLLLLCRRRLSEKLDLDQERVVRTREEMAAEAAELRVLFPELQGA